MAHPLSEIPDPFAVTAEPIIFHRDPMIDASLHVVGAGSIRCQECWKEFHLNEVPFCSSQCRTRYEDRLREAAA